ncbi:MAG: HEAT repeat domain-containing protein [Acidimicrobiales bacterium]
MHDPRAFAEARRRGAAARAGHDGDEIAARSYLADPDPGVRAAALASLVRIGCHRESDVEAALGDSSSMVRSRLGELGGSVSAELGTEGLLRLLSDDDAGVVEAACFAAGEIGDRDKKVVAKLIAIATDHPDPLCRESAVAALGAIGEESGLGAILVALRDRPAIRRRAVIALAPFSGPEVESALAAALEDRDWQVRQAAEDLRS